jgi:iron-sulfur cluster repair protein YtfE (RIC family)
MGYTYKKDGTLIPKIKDVGVSSLGFAMFLDSLIHRDSEESEQLDEFISTITADAEPQAGAKKTFKTLHQFKKKAQP